LKRVLFDENFTPRFPLYWQIPEKFKSCDENLLSAEEKADIEVLRSLPRLISTKELIKTQLVGDPVAYFEGES